MDEETRGRDLREKVNKGFEHCKEDNSCHGCPYDIGSAKCIFLFHVDILAMLKEQEPVEPYADYVGHDVWRCGNCGAAIFYFHNDASDEDEKIFSKFCTHCGRPVKWNS